MKHFIITLLIFPLALSQSMGQVIQYPRASDQTILLARALSRDIFELNGVPYLQPLAEVVNATSNSRFYSTAFLPKGNKRFYIRISINGMYGIVPNNKKEYSPVLPNEPMNPNMLPKYVDLSNPLQPKIIDTVGLIYYVFRTLIHDGLQRGSLQVPSKAPTILGYGQVNLLFPHDTLVSLIINNPLYPLLPKNYADSVLNAIANFPEVFELPRGLNIKQIGAGIPQLEIGSLYGTELLIRFIPQIELGKNIGKFSFWGLGIKHSISQYITNPFMDVSLQIGRQGSRLTNRIGVTNAELTANAKFWNANLHLSKKVNKKLEFFSGVSFENLEINSDYTFYLPAEVQYQLGLYYHYDNGTPEDYTDDYLAPNPDLGYTGDPFPPMNKNVIVRDKNWKWTIGVIGNFGPFSLVVDFSLSKINIFSFALMYRFDIKKHTDGITH
ncbi:MAG: DUF6588 family protein [Candidatus Kapaibacteriales bacterium]